MSTKSAHGLAAAAALGFALVAAQPAAADGFSLQFGYTERHAPQPAEFGYGIAPVDHRGWGGGHGGWDDRGRDWRRHDSAGWSDRHNFGGRDHERRWQGGERCFYRTKWVWTPWGEKPRHVRVCRSAWW